MKLAVFADDKRQKCMTELMKLTAFKERLCNCTYYNSYDGFIGEIPYQDFDAVIVAHRGALGMQAARAAKILLHRVPIIWFSDDAAFVEESYRIGCSYFSADPITKELLSLAFDRFDIKGEN